MLNGSQYNSNAKIPSEGFSVSGEYRFDLYDNHATPAIAYYEHSPIEDAPVVVVLHGFRGDPNGENNIEFAEMAQALGFSTVRIAHAGFDHYGCDNAPETKDTGSLVSNVKDLELILDKLGHRKVILLPSSGSLNVAYAVGRNDERVSHIVGVSSFPDMYDFIQAAKGQGQKDLDEKGYHIAERFGPTCKITTPWLDDGNPVSMSHHIIPMLAPHQPSMIMVRAARDPVVNPSKLPFFDGFLRAFERAGHPVTDIVLDQKTHKPTPEIFRAVKDAMEQAAKDVGFSTRLTQPTLTPQISHPHRG